MSDPKHFKRPEQWIILEGLVNMKTEWNSVSNEVTLQPHGMPHEIEKEVWHKASNPGEVNSLLEIPMGRVLRRRYRKKGLMNKVFIGYDTREDIAYQVCKHSIETKSENVDIRPLKQQELRDAGWYTRS